MQLYKFTSITPRAITSIASGKFWASTLDRMNDPFEDRFDASDGLMIRLVRGCGVFCASRSEPGDRDVLLNPLMWAHYSSTHAGIAIGLKPHPDKSPFVEVEYLSDRELDQRMADLRVRYANRTKEVASPWATVAFKYKPLFWSYENEYRRVVVAGNRYIDPFADINEIVFGFRSRPDEELAVWTALRDNVHYRKANNRKGKIVIEDYNPPTRIDIDNEFTLVVDPTDIDIGKIPEAEKVKPPGVRFS